MLLSCGDVKMDGAEISDDFEEVNKTSENLELEIIQVILDKAKKSSPKPPPILVMKLGESEVDFECRKENLFDSIHKKWGETIFEFIVIDTLYAMSYEIPIEFLDSTFLIDSTSNVFTDDIWLINLNLINQNGFKLIDTPKDDSLYRESLHALFKKDEFNSVFSFSKMLFNSDKSQVIFSYSKICGGLCGGGFVVKMMKDDGSWVVLESKLTWVA